MALIGGRYVFVETESLDTPVEVSEHAVEAGVDITSHVRAKPAVLTLSGEIVGDGYEDTVATLRNWARGGYAISYVGRNVFPYVHISSFSTRATAKIAGGVAFEAQLRELRIARRFTASYDYTGDLLVHSMHYDGTVSVENLAERRERYHRLAAGETLLYVASQYKNRGVTAEGLRSANRERDIFYAGHAGDFAFLVPGAQLLLGVW